MPTIEFQNVTKKFGEVTAVKDLNFTIYDGEYVSLLGPSGCGKTTTLRMLAGLIQPTSGTILWDNKRIDHLEPSERDIGYVFQNFAIFPHLTVWENIAYGPEVKGYSKRDVEDKVEEHIRLVGLSSKAHLYPRTLSAADLQRVGIARVLAAGATTLLLDEPVGALDQKIREQFQDELRSLVKRLHLTALHVTHDQSEAMAISDRIGVMKKGKMIQVGTPEELLFSPKHIFTSHFIGESDFLEGVVSKETPTHLRLEFIGGEFLIIPKPSPSPLLGDRIILGVRREFIKIAPESPIKSGNTFLGTILDDIFLGEKWRTLIDLGLGRQIQAKRPISEPPFKKGSKVDVYLPPEHVTLFPYPEEGLIEALSVT